MGVARQLTVAVLVLLTVTPGLASAHVGPSATVNNRYYKLTPMADRVRIVYTVFFGREPGSALRRQMDTDRDGVLSQDEIAAYGRGLQSEIENATSVKLGGKDAAVRWSAAEMGMGTHMTGGGAFSADLIGTVCLQSEDPEFEHQIHFSDGLLLDSPGETELRLDPAPGIRVSVSALADRDIGLFGQTWQGGPGPAQAGYQLSFFVERQDSAGLDDSCISPPKAPSRRSTLLIGALAGVLIACALVILWRSRRRNVGAAKR